MGKKKKKRTCNKHHLIAKFEGGSNSPKNIKTINITKHRLIHEAFGTKKPHEQLLEIIKINDSCFDEKFKREVFNLLEKYKGSYYKEECFLDYKKNKG